MFSSLNSPLVARSSHDAYALSCAHRMPTMHSFLDARAATSSYLQQQVYWAICFGVCVSC
jgi:hypothetical protein